MEFNLKKFRFENDLSQEELGHILNVTKQHISKIENGKATLTKEKYNILADKYNLSLQSQLHDDNQVVVTYRPNVYLSAGYGIEVYDEDKQTMTLDARLLTSERGNKINPKCCEIVRVSGNSMAPEYQHGDRVIIDRGDTELLDGHIFAFRYNGNCFVKEINLLGDKIKCISLNKDYDPFYINKGDDFTVLGRIIPRVRL